MGSFVTPSFPFSCADSAKLGLAGVSCARPKILARQRMAFDYEYWMVYLPALSSASFLLFAHNPAGSTSLRDYSSGKCRKIDPPGVQQVRRDTILGETRFVFDPHRTDDETYWSRRTQELNARHIPAFATRSAVVAEPPIRAARGAPTEPTERNATFGRARWGSRRQLQDYVNEHETALTRAVMESLPEDLRQLGAGIQWVSPLARDNYLEYRDLTFLGALGITNAEGRLTGFWPKGGPCWDALGIISASDGRPDPAVILIEAKSHIREIYGGGCQAGPRSRGLIDRSLSTARRWCGAREDADWSGALYQSANRLAHLYFLRERLKRPAWLVNLYFLNDPIGPTDRAAWNSALRVVKSSLGLESTVPFAVDVFLPALEISGAVQIADFSVGRITKTSTAGQESFVTWANSWMHVARYDGAVVADVDQRIEQLVRLWHDPIPGSWLRTTDVQLHGERYRRGDRAQPNAGEHMIEHEILHRDFEGVSCFGTRLVDGVNALPLVRDAGGGREANIEADMFLLSQQGEDYRLWLCEVKDESNNAWYAAIENLRQLRLLMSSPASMRVFTRRLPSVSLPVDMPVTGLVLAPLRFYSSPGKKANSVAPAQALLARFLSEFAVDVRLAVWDSTGSIITDYSGY
jgi:hypothetical protein